MLVIRVPLPSQRLGGKCDFYRHLHSVLDCNNKQIFNFGIFPLSSRYHIYEMIIHSSYAHICGTTERGIILTDCQLLCLWKLGLWKLGHVCTWPRTISFSVKGNRLGQIFLVFWFPHITSFCSLLSSRGRESSGTFSFETSLWTDDICDTLCMASW